MDDLVGAGEIAERLGWPRRQVIHDWRLRYSDFPKPVVDREALLLWEWSRVLSWAEANGKVRS